MARLRTWVTVLAVGILALVGVSPAAAEDVTPKVVGGTTATIADAPWQVGLVMTGYNNDVGQFCGGSILNSEWILTAAHCFRSTVRDEASEVQVVAGTALLTADQAGQSAVAEIIRHPSFDGTTYENDVALLRLTLPLTLATGAREAIALPIAEDPATWPADGTDALITGWGSISSTPYVGQTTLRKATVDVLGGPVAAACGSYGSSYFPASMLCAGVAGGGIDTCQGDSGGPLAINLAGTWTLAGITSWGTGCALAAYPGVYTRVSTYDTWVVPGAPTGVAGTTAADTSVALTWTAPTGTVSSAITGYVVSYSSDSGSTWSTPVATGSTSAQYTVTGLTAGTAYLFRVGAVNAVNAATGPAGPVGATAVAVAPSASMAVTAMATGQTTATIAIDATGTAFAGGIDGWAFAAVSGGGTLGTPTLDGATVTIPVTGLAAGTSYTWTIRATKGTAVTHAGTSNAVTTTAASGGGGGGGGAAPVPVEPAPAPAPVPVEPTPEPIPPAPAPIPAPPVAVTGLGSGITLVPQPRATVQRVPASGPVARARAEAPTVIVPARRTVIPFLRGVRPSTEFTAWILVKQTRSSPRAWARMGVTTSSATGVVRLPAFRATMTGTFPLRLTAPGVPTAYARATVVSPR